jgi:3'(2'), 5'-bisphosphate nucleotidase
MSGQAMKYQHELDAALEAARQAGDAVLEIYAGFEQVADAPAEITTEADRRSQEIIIGQLHRAFPGDGFCAEEATAQLSGLPRTGRRVWVIDPIDGTRGFARKNGEFSIMVGLLDAGAVAVGVVLEPVRERLTYAAFGEGCFRRDRGERQPAQCHVSANGELSKATVAQSRSHHGTPSAEMRAIAPARTVETYSAGIKLAMAARGEVDIYLNIYPRFHDWDVCAGQVLVTEAGGMVTGLGGEPIIYGVEDRSQRLGLIATNGKLHPALVRVLGKSAEKRV